MENRLTCNRPRDGGTIGDGVPPWGAEKAEPEKNLNGKTAGGGENADPHVRSGCRATGDVPPKTSPRPRLSPHRPVSEGGTMPPMGDRQRRRIDPTGLLHPAQCNATNREGEPCRRAPVIGATVCGTHGGRAPHVRAAADQRIADAAATRALDATLARMNLDAPPIADPAAAMASLAGRLLSGFEGVQSRLNECREQGRVPNDVDIAERALWVKELRSLLTDMTRLQVGVQLASRYMPDGKAPGGDVGAEQDAVVSVDLPDVSSIVAAVLETEHRLETDRLVKVEQAKAQGQLPAGLQVVAGVVESEAQSA